MTSRTPTPAEIAGLPFEEDNGMYGNWDLPEDNERARKLTEKYQFDWHCDRLAEIGKSLKGY